MPKDENVLGDRDVSVCLLTNLEFQKISSEDHYLTSGEAQQSNENLSGIGTC